MLRSDVTCVPIRGNANTRLAKVRDGELDAVVLAYAGLARIGHTDLVTQIFEPDEMVPAPGQGALAVECRSDDVELAELLATIDDQATRAAVTAERSLLAALEAGCSAPVGAYAVGQAANSLRLHAVVLLPPGGRPPGTPLGMADKKAGISDMHDICPASSQAGRLDVATAGMTMVVRERGEADVAAAASLGRELAARMLAGGAADLMSAKTDREDSHD